MNNTGFRRKRKFDITMLLFICVILGIGWSIDMGFIKSIPDTIQIKNDIRRDIMFSVFAAQVSVSTLGIALISILGAIAKDTIYGISISQYLMEDRPLIFKHKVNIIIQLMLIGFSYVFMSLEGFNFLICIFFISIIIVCMMVWDVFTIFYGNEYIRKEVYGYFIEVFNKNKIKKNDKRKTLLKGIKKDTLIAIDVNNTVVLKENLNLFNDILDKLSLNMNEKHTVEVRNQFEDDLVDIFNKMFKEGDTNKILIALENIQSLYKKCNEINKNTKDSHFNIYLNILDKVARYIFVSIANILSLESSDYRILFSLQHYMYDNIYFKEIEGNMIPMNNTYLNIYSGRIYYEIINKCTEKYNSKKLFEIKKRMYEEIEMLISYNSFKEFKNEKISQLYIQLYKYTKVLIDNGEKQVLKETLFKLIDNVEYDYSKNNIEYTFIILIYLYYLINVEPLTDDKLKNDAKDLIKLNIESIKYFLITQHMFVMRNEFINNAKNILSTWEIMPEGEAKCLIMDSAIDEFLIFYTLQENWDIVELTSQLKTLVDGNEFSMYMNINESKNIIENYILFINIFYNEEISQEQAEEKIDMLKSSIINLYKESEIKRSKENIKTEYYYNDIKDKIKKVCYKNIEDKIEIFNNIEYENITNTTITLLNLETEIEFLTETEVNNSISNFINTFFTKNIVNIIYENLLKETLLSGKKDVLYKFFELKENSDVESDTIIGYRNVFYSLDRELEYEFKEFEKDKFKIKAQYCNNFIIAIDSSKFYFNVRDISVNIEQFDIDEICKKLKKNDKGEYLYKITNNIYLPFNEDELRQYISNRKRNVTVEANVEYGFKDEVIGYGVFIEPNRN